MKIVKKSLFTDMSELTRYSRSFNSKFERFDNWTGLHRYATFHSQSWNLSRSWSK